MKKLLIALGVLVVLAIGALVVLPSLVPADKIEQEVVAQVKSATGRDLSIDGKVSVSAFPSLSVQVSNVALSNPPGFQGKDMVRLGALDVRLKLLPILSGKVEVDSFVLIDPIISLEVDRHGKANWVFDSEPKPQAKAEAKDSSSGGTGLKDLSLGQVRITSGKLTYVDGKAGTKEEVDAINLAVDLKNLDSPLKAKGGLKWHGKTIDLAVDVTRPRALLDGTASPAELSVATEAVKLAFKGEASGAAVKGDLDLAVPSVRGLVLWTTGKPLDMAGTGLGPFSLTGKLAAGGTMVALTQAAIGLDAIRAKGDFTADTGGARPSLKGKLDVDALDLNPYLPPEQPAKASTASAGKSDWSDAPIDASGLKAADVDFALSVGSITIQKIKIGKSALHLALNGGRLNADLSQLELYQGSGKGRLGLDGSQPGVGLDASFTLKGLAAEPFLTDAASFDRLSGTGDADIQVSGRGKSERALVSSLNGKGDVTFLNGAIKGINLAEMMRNVGTAFTAGSGSQKTDFAELGGTFTIDNGIVTNKDLALKSPLLRVEGAGTVELPPRTVHYRVEPKAVASLEGQGGQGDLGGIKVPVIVEGPWDNLSFRPDMAAMAKGQANEAIQGAIGRKLPTGLLGGGTQPADQQKSGSAPLPINPGGLFGR
ncbi:MAG: AsmA family protein [Rhodospirillaceae bacterium]|nr:AsmA family protein [Rhodospirillales bacterium]